MSFVAVLDVGNTHVRVLVGSKNDKGNWRIIGAGDAEARGFEKGAIVHLGDAVEACLEAISRASRPANLNIERIYFNLDSKNFESLYRRGSRRLSSETEIRNSDVAAAVRSAERSVDHFERRILYASPAHFLIDGRDAVANPLGVSGRELEAEVHFVTMPAVESEQWQTLFERAYLPKAVPILSILSTLWAVLAAEDKSIPRVVADLGFDFTNIALYRPGGIAARETWVSGDFKTEELLQKVREFARAWAEKSPDIQEILVTGDYLQEASVVAMLKEASPIPCRMVSPAVIPNLQRPNLASLVGLLGTAWDMERKRSLTPRKGYVFSGIKKKAKAFLEEYF